MKQILLALILVATPVVAFSGFQMYATRAVAAGASLGDLSALKQIVTDVQAKAASGDMAGAKDRITDFEIAWDGAEAGMRPINPDAWGKVDQASDAALKAVRAKIPDAAKAKSTLAALLGALDNPGAKPVLQ